MYKAFMRINDKALIFDDKNRIGEQDNCSNLSSFLLASNIREIIDELTVEYEKQIKSAREDISENKHYWGSTCKNFSIFFLGEAVMSYFICNSASMAAVNIVSDVFQIYFYEAIFFILVNSIYALKNYKLEKSISDANKDLDTLDELKMLNSIKLERALDENVEIDSLSFTGKVLSSKKEGLKNLKSLIRDYNNSRIVSSSIIGSMYSEAKSPEIDLEKVKKMDF